MANEVITPDVSVAHHVAYIENMVIRGGPEPEEWAELNKWIQSIAIARKEKLISEEDFKSIQKAFGESFSLKTLQGLCLIKPRGYTGDFEIIDCMYRHHLSDDPHLRKWDEFLQAHDSVKAVRNRKDYFKEWVLLKCSENKGRKLTLLNLASGPGRDVAEFLTENPSINLDIDCVEWDMEAINYAKALLPEGAYVKFIHQNIFKFTADRSYDLIWSAGLFDYFDDVTFQHILSRLLKWLNPKGEITIGNFQPNHGTYYYMQLVEWQLYHRSSNELLVLANSCGVPLEHLQCKSEPLGANLFLHITDKGGQ